MYNLFWIWHKSAVKTTTTKQNKTKQNRGTAVQRHKCLKLFVWVVESWAHCEREWPSRHVWSLLWPGWLSCPGNRLIILSGFVSFYGVRLDHTFSTVSAMFIQSIMSSFSTVFCSIPKACSSCFTETPCLSIQTFPFSFLFYSHWALPSTLGFYGWEYFK